ncbi:MAG: signal recognition particle-docking protein FtsY [Treponema sp.]|jgi:fused signal recognition particle receptor|nr:signal recognition particle-docking protein FtsY [Treponema sp.]
MIPFSARIKSFFSPQKLLDDEVFDDLADLLVEGDFGASLAFEVTESLRGLCKKEKVTTSEGARGLLAGLLEGLLAQARAPRPFPPAGNLAAVLLLGVNGVGKTTTAAKLAAHFLAGGRRPILAAADTFRAAAAEQLRIHGERLGVRVVSHERGGDPGAVLFDAADAAKAGRGDVIIADTAGRMHTKASLVEELRKIGRVLETKAAGAPCFNWLVLDATAGRNAFAQAETFSGAVKLDGVILTKYDSGAKGGVVFSLAKELKLGVVFLCTGETYGDIRAFDAKAYTEAFAGITPSR